MILVPEGLPKKYKDKLLKSKAKLISEYWLYLSKELLYLLPIDIFEITKEQLASHDPRDLLKNLRERLLQTLHGLDDKAHEAEIGKYERIEEVRVKLAKREAPADQKSDQEG